MTRCSKLSHTGDSSQQAQRARRPRVPPQPGAGSLVPIDYDQPDVGFFRSFLLSAFSPGSVREMQPMIQEMTMTSSISSSSEEQPTCRRSCSRRCRLS